jgi:hypothetical protein
MLSLIFTLTCGFYLLLAFIVSLNPRKVNIKANKWLALFLLSIVYSDERAPVIPVNEHHLWISI